MRLQIIPIIGGKPLEIEASQVVITNHQGTPVCVAGEFGSEGAIKTANAADADFNQTLRAFGYGRHQVKTSIIDAPPPLPGSRLVSLPR